MGVVGLLLLIGFANPANLLLARAPALEKEIGHLAQILDSNGIYGINSWAETLRIS